MRDAVADPVRLVLRDFVRMELRVWVCEGENDVDPLLLALRVMVFAAECVRVPEDVMEAVPVAVAEVVKFALLVHDVVVVEVGVTECDTCGQRGVQMPSMEASVAALSRNGNPYSSSIVRRTV